MEPLSLNRYSYTWGNPVNYQDPSGNRKTVIRLPNFVTVTDGNGNTYYGGNQSWYSDLPASYYSALDPKKFPPMYRKILKNVGCGLIAAANIAAYLGMYGDSKYGALYGYGNFDMGNYLQLMFEIAEYMEPETCGVYAGANIGTLIRGLEDYAQSKGVDISGKWFDWTLGINDMIEFIKDALLNNKPIAMMIGTNNSSEFSNVVTDTGAHGSFSQHWVTITGLIYDDRTGTYEVEVSSWGGKAVINLLTFFNSAYKALVYFE